MTDSLNRARLGVNHELLPKEKISQDIKEQSPVHVPSSAVVEKEHRDVARKDHLHDDRYLRSVHSANQSQAESGTNTNRWMHSLATYQLFMSLLAKTQKVDGRWTFDELVIGGKSADNSAAVTMVGETTNVAGVVSRIVATNNANGVTQTLAFTNDGQVLWNGRSLALKEEVLGLDSTAKNAEALGSDSHFKWQNVSRGMIPFPAGGRLDFSGAINHPIGIEIPDDIDGKYGFSLVIYESGLDAHNATIMHVNGVYDQGSKEWHSVDAYRSNEGPNVKVHFARKGNRPVVWFENHNGTWNNPMVTVLNLAVSRPDLRELNWYSEGVRILVEGGVENTSTTTECVSLNNSYLGIDATAKNSARLGNRTPSVNANNNTVAVRDGSGRLVTTTLIANQTSLPDNHSDFSDLEFTTRNKKNNELTFLSKVAIENWLSKATLTEYGLTTLSNALTGSRANVAATEKAVGDLYQQSASVVHTNLESGVTLSRTHPITRLVYTRNEAATLTLNDTWQVGDRLIIHRANSKDTQFSIASAHGMRVYFPGVGEIEETAHTITGTCLLELLRIEDHWLVSVHTG